ncbi:hypothetical protein [Roseateles toxinivorans]|uniref:Uncharacterized protein n=1 Tax=Roseateles toxinivorans TaxID=270368 RepID=A0A4R6QF63_9BURK|nr:hypothetical protein [Roseateles toxinivorans]TDP60646.1 hypothetical protein DES47_11568 [Roseateles toxinivorans]
MVSTLIKGMLATAVVIAAAVAGIYIFVASEVFTLVTTGASALLSASGLPVGLALPFALFVSILVAGPLIRYGAKTAIGRPPLLPTLLAAGASAVVGGGWLYVSRDWFFGLNGEPIAYVCPPIYGGANARIQRISIDHYLGGRCEPISRETAAHALALRNASPITALDLSSEAELLALPRFDAEGPLILVGDAVEARAPPRLFKGRVGIDPGTGRWLRPATDQDIGLAIAHLARKREEVEALARSAVKAREAEDQKSRLTARSETDWPRAKHQKKAVEADDEDEDEEVEAERSQPGWGQHFVADIGRNVPLVIVLGNLGDDVKLALSSQLAGGGSFWNERVLRTKNFIPEVAAPLLDNPYRSLRRDSFPPSLTALIVAKPEYQLPNGWWCVSVVRFNISNWSATKQSIAMAI